MLQSLVLSLGLTVLFVPVLGIGSLCSYVLRYCDCGLCDYLVRLVCTNVCWGLSVLVWRGYSPIVSLGSVVFMRYGGPLACS